MAKNVDNTEHTIEVVESALSKTEHFIEKNQKIIGIVVGVIILLVLAVIGYQKLILLPKEQKAQAEIFYAEKYFEMDSLNLALNGDGAHMGFLEIIEEYSATKQANLAHYYAGICYLNLGKFEEAITYLSKFSSADKIIAPMAKGAIGDAYMELGDKNKAASYYTEAAEVSDNELTAPLFLKKAGSTYELAGDNQKALDMYKKIQANYIKSLEGREIEKHIAKIEALLAQ